NPRDCVVIEDSAAGVLAGEAAGCAVLAVPSVAGVSILPKPRVQVVHTLAGVDVQALKALVAS
ncbi:MAG: family phosphatase, partial [Frankiales bacterium]|nr:family phosphatase [Frankiales bacterium]